MSEKWNLNNLYPSFDGSEIKEDLKKFEELLSQASTFAKVKLIDNMPSAKIILEYFAITNELFSKFDIIINYANLTYSVDTNNTTALSWIEKMESYYPQLTLIQVAFKRYLKNIINIDDFINENLELKDYAFTIKSEKIHAKYLLSDEEESLLSEMKNTGSNAWSKLQDLNISTLLVNYNEEKLPLTVIRNYAYSFDNEKRKKAYDAEIKAYEKIDKISASCLNAIKGEVLTVAKKRGFDSPLSMTLMASRMDKEILDAMISAIESKLSIFRKYLNKKAQLLGHSSNKLPFYDLFAPVGNVDMSFTYDEAKEFIIENFTSFSKKLGGYAKKAFDNNWIDPFPREGKIGGAFCSNLHGIKESRIMSNFSGNFNDVSTLAHELGHGYHGDCLKDELYNNSDYPMPLAETASIFAETLVVNAALKKVNNEQALVILENELSGATQVIVDIYSRYLFETALLEKRKISSIPVSELKELMLDAQRKAYGDSLDENYLHPYMWICKPHYYNADFNFYNFPYAFGLLFAKGLYANYLKEGDAFIPKYDALLKSTGCNNIYDVLATMNIDAHSSEFFINSLELIEKNIEHFINL